jgi:hypothetical protein
MITILIQSSHIIAATCQSLISFYDLILFFAFIGKQEMRITCFKGSFFETLRQKSHHKNGF